MTEGHCGWILTLHRASCTLGTLGLLLNDHGQGFPWTVESVRVEVWGVCCRDRNLEKAATILMLRGNHHTEV